MKTWAVPTFKTDLSALAEQLPTWLIETRHWRLATKLTVLMTLVALVPLAIVIAQNDLRTRASLIGNQKSELQRAARETAQRIDARLLERKRLLLAFASSPLFGQFAREAEDLGGGAAEGARLSLANLTRDESIYESAFIANPKGEVLLSAGRAPTTGLGGRDFFKASVNGTPSISGLETLSDGRRAYFVAAPLQGEQNAVTAVLIVRVQGEDLEQLVEADQGRLGTSSFGALWDRGGTRLSASRERGAGAASPELVRQLGEVRGNVDFRIESSDGAWLLGAQPLATHPWVYTIQASESSLLDGLNTATRLSWLGFLLAVLGVSLGTAHLLTRPLLELQRVAGAIRFGNFSARARVDSRDELGEVATSVNQMLDEVTTLVQTREERDRIQQQIITLLSEVSNAAEGDLTIEAQVTDGALGSVADAFNYMVGELRTIIANVNATTVQVSSSTGEILAASSQLVRSAGEQAQKIAATSVAIDEMAQSISRVSEHARLSAQVAAEARQNARQGLESVRATIGGMQRIRGQVQQTAKQIKRLGESSQEIGQIIELIEEMADQTNLLALNAAIQAAMAGEHGRGFAVVADEVRRLAERAANATRQINLLVKSIQAETTQAVISMENNTREVVEGSRLADTAGQSLEAIEAVVSRLAELSERISQAAEQQAEASRDINQTMAQISDVTRATSAGTQRTSELVDYLNRLADQLRSSVAAFRLSKSEA
jgi:methyl-accepting chemotaxis protein